MDLEALLLRAGPRSIADIQSSFNVSDEELRSAPGVAEWFIQFVLSREEEWIGRVNIQTAERLWRSSIDGSAKRSATELILAVEASNDAGATRAYGSLLVSLFREGQADPFSPPLSRHGQIVFDVLVDRLKFTASTVFQDLKQGSLARYSLATLKYCFRDLGQPLSDFDIGFISRLAGELPADVRERFSRLKLIA